MVEPTLTETKSKQLFERAKKSLPGGVNSPVRAFEPYPFFVECAQGSKMYDADGKAYVDYCMAYGALLLGHANAEILDAVKKQLAMGTLYGAPTEREVELAELISKASPCMEMMRLVNSGTEATMHAIRAARGYTNRKKIIKFDGCFHGSHDNVLVKAGSGAATFGSPNSLGIPEETTQNTIVLPYNDVEALEATFKSQGNGIAAVIVEPVLANVGLILPKKDYLTYLRKVTSVNGAVLIFDEIITGFRLGLGGAQEYFKVKPDMATLGQGAWRRLPVGGVWRQTRNHAKHLACRQGIPSWHLQRQPDLRNGRLHNSQNPKPEKKQNLPKTRKERRRTQKSSNRSIRSLQTTSPSLQHRLTLSNLLHQQRRNRLRLRQTLRPSNVHRLLPRTTSAGRIHSAVTIRNLLCFNGTYKR